MERQNRGALLILELTIGFVLLGIVLLPRWLNEKKASERPRIDHVVLLVLPRGDAAEASLMKLAEHGALLRNSHALAHPSLPNRVALISGSAWGLTVNDIGIINRHHLGNQLDQKRIEWRVYADDEALATFPYFVRFEARRTEPLANLGSKPLPRFAYVGATTFPPALQQLPPHTLLIATIDEGRGATNDVLTVLAGDAVRAGAVSRAWYDHYSILRTVENLLGLTPMTHHDRDAHPIDDVWRQ